jgi:P-type Mg2+ transporter
MKEKKTEGLTDREAKKLLRKYGPNAVVYKVELSPFLQFLLEFKNPLFFILLIAAAVSFFLGEWMSSVIIIIMVLLSTTLEFYNTYKSQKAAAALQEKVRTTATVIRDGITKEMPLLQLVPGDLVLLEPGDIVPADGSVIESEDFFLDESTLTGESYPVEKSTSGGIYMGSNVVTGKAKAIVTATGRATKFSHIAESLVKNEEPSEFDRGLQKFSYLILKLVLFLVIGIFFVNAILHHGILDSFLFAVALAVGLTPELLPMIITFNLSKGSLLLAKKGVIVKKLSAIQNFGSMDILCTDKTGTLTEGKIVLVKCVDCRGEQSDEVLRSVYINSIFESGIKNPMDNAVREFKDLSVAGYKKIDEMPFDYKRRRGSVVVEKDGKRMIISKGMPEEMFKIATKCSLSPQPLAGQQKESVYKIYEDLSAQGYRVLAVCGKEVAAGKKYDYTKEDEQEMTMLGYAAFLDPPKSTVKDTLAVMEQYGIEIKVLTGDNELVTEKIARDIGLNVKGMIKGAEIEKMDDAKLSSLVERITIFARLSPDQKVRIIKILQGKGHVVGYLGDGINDAPSLKAADAGISVNNAVDVAKESADLILLKKSLKEMVEGVIEGRKTFANTFKYLMMILSSNFGNMFSMAGASIFLPFLPMLPPQILFNNILYDASQFTIPLDNVDKEDILKPRKWNINYLKKFMLVFGPVSSVFDFATFFVLLYVFNLHESAFQTGWFLESLATQTLVVFIIRTRKFSFTKSRPSWPLTASVLAVVLFSWLVVYSGLGGYFQFARLDFVQAGAIGLIVIAYLFCVEGVKKWFFSRVIKKAVI